MSPLATAPVAITLLVSVFMPVLAAMTDSLTKTKPKRPTVKQTYTTNSMPSTKKIDHEEELQSRQRKNDSWRRRSDKLQPLLSSNTQ